MEVDTHINKCIVYIIESLPDGDLKTGRNLNEKLRQEWIYNDDYDSIYKVVDSKRELREILFEIAEIVKTKDNHTFYILQFEAHGSDKGMCLSSKEEISWGELFSLIRPINIYMNDTLLVVLSMCNSKSVAYNIEPRERSPFRGVVVSDMDLPAGYIDEIWEGFYKVVMSHFFEGKSSGHFSDFTPEHIWYLNQEFIFDIHSDLEEYHPELFVEMKDGKPTEKVYQPFNKNGFKWRNSHDKSVWDLWTKLPPRGEKVIITSSRKDALCIWANTGIPSVSLQSETASIKPQVMQELKDRFKTVYILYDNDYKQEAEKGTNPGREAAKAIAEQFDIVQIEIPTSYKAKDSSDLFKQYGKDIFLRVFKQLIK